MEKSIFAKGRGALLLTRVGLYMGHGKTNDDKAALPFQKKISLPAFFKKRLCMGKACEW
jgi:hypothetical protein